jgi:hypothetical protein
MRRQSVAAIVAVAVVLMLAAGCGGKKSSSSPSSSSSSSSSGSSGSSSSSSSGTPSFTSTKNCAQLASLASKVAQSMKSTGNAQKDIGNEVKLFDALADAAPSEIKSDLRTFADAFGTFAKTYSGSGITMGQAPSATQLAKLQKAAGAFSAPKVRAAEQHLSAWSQKNCGLTATNP